MPMKRRVLACWWLLALNGDFAPGSVNSRAALQHDPAFSHAGRARSLGMLAAMQAAAPEGPAPAVFFVDVEAGPVSGGPDNLGVPISIFGKGFGAERGPSRVTIGGVEVARYLVWGANNAHNRTLDMIVVQPGARVKGGPIVVEVNGRPSDPAASFTATNGKVYYVSPTGDDRNTCSQQAPCATLQHVAAEVLGPGDAVLIRGGVYQEGEVWIRAEQGGLPGRPKIIKAYPGEEAYLRNPARDLIVDADHITISGLNFQNGKSLAAVGWASPRQRGARFVNNTFSGTIAWAAIDTHGDDHLVAGNVCEVSGSSVGTMGHCYYISQGSNLKILYNIASGAPGYGLHIYDERRAAQDFRRVIRNVVVEGNILKNSTQRSGMILAMEDQGNYGNYIDQVLVRNNIFAANNHFGLIIQGPVRNVKVLNNTFYQNGRQAIYIAGDARVESVELRNNLFYQSGNGNCRADCTWFSAAHLEVGSAARNVVVSNNSYHPGSPVLIGRSDARAVEGVVRFENAEATDFRPLPGSAVIDRGVTLAEVARDYDGRPRPQGGGFDIGAFEYQARTPVLHSVRNGASWREGPLAPGSVVTCLGWRLGPEQRVTFRALEGRLETSLAGTSALFDDVPAPLISVQENHVTALVPSAVINRGAVRVEIEVEGRRSNALLIPVAATAPGIFTQDGSGEGPAAALNADGSLNRPSNPAERSSVIVLYATGLGQTEVGAGEADVVGDPPPRPLAPVAVWIGGAEAEVLYAGNVVGFIAGLYQINARIPESTPSGPAVPVVILAGQTASQPGVTVAVR